VARYWEESHLFLLPRFTRVFYTAALYALDYIYRAFFSFEIALLLSLSTSFLPLNIHEVVRGEEAMKLGFVSEVTPDATSAHEAALRWAKRAAAGGPAATGALLATLRQKQVWRLLKYTSDVG